VHWLQNKNKKWHVITVIISFNYIYYRGVCAPGDTNVQRLQRKRKIGQSFLFLSITSIKLVPIPEEFPLRCTPGHTKGDSMWYKGRFNVMRMEIYQKNSIKIHSMWCKWWCLNVFNDKVFDTHECLCVKRDLLQCQKRPTTVSKCLIHMNVFDTECLNVFNTTGDVFNTYIRLNVFNDNGDVFYTYIRVNVWFNGFDW
jgi:hypothetical protein